MGLDLSFIHSVDTQNMWDLLLNFPDQWKDAMNLSEDIELTVDQSAVRNICFVGMGGSALGADLLRAYCYHCCPYPIQVVRHYEIPGWVGEDTLVIGCSFSGKTEETLTALTSARERGAQVIGITSGGNLMLKAASENFDYVKIPSGMTPRAALGYIFLPLFYIFRQFGFVDEGEEALEETYQLMLQENEQLSNRDDNEALDLATQLQDTLPIIYSDATIMEPVNLRWREQFQESAKTLAYGNTLPEMTHNEIVGWDRIAHLTGRLSLILLVDNKDHERVKKRMAIVEEMVEGQTASLHVLGTRGESRLARMFSLIQLADWTSFYLAMLSNTDPTPVTKIDLLKSKLAET
ncbi:bifunctional phosphoglucose/phosphomannose isomerase [Fodinibius salsisoli]|uniref:Bifunctional phosphoglucose/phosphomannose isomerase n=1 Tax=Fodinibius salsisoli TaxID=2820877 RepID=A0ABT3PRP6_9BACT|nr:bifunctional phosphoglucose/phosphomannose isomerase [Fodinibius salsisoli]MCW9708527.1 bifunctional phosphoglucose/phosphomannose isomerase [Fodinibius salsisoli]